MAGMFGSKPKMPDPPKPTRMPNQTDPDVLAAGARVRDEALRRKGRLSTIMTDSTSDVGSYGSGDKLGA